MKRVNWIDAFKGCAMILIVLGHTLRAGLIRNVVYYFHVPAFFFISGITIKDVPLSKTYVLSQAQRLLIPYYSFGAISIIIYGVLGKFAAGSLDMSTTSGFWENIGDLFYGASGLSFNGPLWFLPALFVTKIMYQFLYVCLRGNKKLMSILVILGCILGYAYTNSEWAELPMSMELVLKLFPFFLVGKVCKPLLISVGSNQTQRKKCLAVATIVLLVTCVTASNIPPLNYTDNRIPIPAMFYSVAILGCIGLYCLAVYIQNSKCIGLIGKKSLAILVMHKFPIVFFQVMGPLSGFLKKPDTIVGILAATLVSVLAIISSMVVGYLIEKWCPILLGLSREDSCIVT